MEVNPARPRRGSFEVTLLRPDGSSEWAPGTGGRREAPVSDRRHLGMWGERLVHDEVTSLSVFSQVWSSGLGLRRGPHANSSSLSLKRW